MQPKLEEVKGEPKRDDRKLWLPQVFVGVIIDLTGDMSAKSLVLCLLKKNPGDAVKSLDWELIAARVGWGRGRKGDRLGWHKFCFFCLFDSSFVFCMEALYT